MLQKICLTINPSVYSAYKDMCKKQRFSVSGQVQKLVESDLKKNNQSYWHTNK